MAGTKPDNNVKNVGERMYAAISGVKQVKRSKLLFWIRSAYRRGDNGNNSPDLGMPKRDYKMMIDSDGSHIQLYNDEKDMGKSQNLKDTEPDKTAELMNELEDCCQSSS
ncbi:alkaline phosphatase family protein [Draconibacterium sediminis]|uniref:hypothetical protein n=1 Tax=Draconibacterium sediminis TaxID=1544798 RepID=UPI0018DCEABE|nr:hypothetical protein [Draconibacterium sediminis]